MKTLLSISAVMALLCLGLLVASIPIEDSYRHRAVLAQRIQRDAAADLFGDKGTLVGGPQLLIIDDPKAFLGEKTPSGASLVDEGYLVRQQIYPLQMKTVEYVARIGRLGSGLGVALGLLGVVYFRRRLARGISTR